MIDNIDVASEMKDVVDDIRYIYNCLDVLTPEQISDVAYKIFCVKVRVRNNIKTNLKDR